MALWKISFERDRSSTRKVVVANAIVALFVMVIFGYAAFGKNGVNFSILGNAFAPGVALAQSLPPSVIELGMLAKASGEDEVALGGTLKSNDLLWQRAHEYLYPIRIVDSHRVFYYLVGDAVDKKCAIEKVGVYFQQCSYVE